MIVVSNTSPLGYLVLIQSIDVLPELFGRVVVPETVAEELSHPKAPDGVRAWIADPPSWLDMVSPTAPDHAIELHPGDATLCVSRSSSTRIRS